MQRIKALKLRMVAGEQEQKILWKLQMELKKEFGKDLWEKSMERKRGKGTTEDIYWWYKKQVKEVMTKSEMAIKLKRASTKGLEHLF